MAVGATEQPPPEEAARRIDEAALTETRSKLEGFLDETQRVGVRSSTRRQRGSHIYRGGGGGLCQRRRQQCTAG